MNKKAYLHGYTAQMSAPQTLVMLGYLAKEAGLTIPEEDVVAILDAPMDKVANEDNMAIALFLEGFSMDKESAGPLTFDSKKGEYGGGWLNSLNLPGKLYDNTIGNLSSKIDYDAINAGKEPTATKGIYNSLRDVGDMIPTNLIGGTLTDTHDANDPTKGGPWYNKVWDWIKANPGKTALAGGGAALLYSLLGKKKQQQRRRPQYGY